MKIEYSTVARCQPAQVWAVFSDLPNWRQWNSMMTASWAEGDPWKPGSHILLEPSQPQMKVKAKILPSTQPYLTGWQGSVMGVNFTQRFEFSSQEDGNTLMKTQIDLSGAATFFISKKMRQQGLDIFAKWFDGLKVEAEKRSALS